MTTHPAKKRVAKCGTLELTDEEEPSVPFGIEFSLHNAPPLASVGFSTLARRSQCVCTRREEAERRRDTRDASFGRLGFR